MCMGTPNIPPPPPPPAPIKTPDQAVSAEVFKKNRNAAAMGGGTLLTGPAGAAAPTGKTSLLGS